ALYAISAMIPLTTLTGAFIGGLEGRRKFALLNGIQSPLLVVGQLMPLVMLPFGINAGLAVVGTAATRLIVLVAVMIACRRYLPLGVIRRVSVGRVMRQIVKFSRWIAVSNFANPFLVSADRVVLGSISSVATMGLYTIPYNLVTRLWLLPSAVSRTLFPEF